MRVFLALLLVLSLSTLSFAEEFISGVEELKADKPQRIIEVYEGCKIYLSNDLILGYGKKGGSFRISAFDIPVYCSGQWNEPFAVSQAEWIRQVFMYRINSLLYIDFKLTENNTGVMREGIISINLPGFQEDMTVRQYPTTYYDVPETHPFYVYIEALWERIKFGGNIPVVFYPDNPAYRSTVAITIAKELFSWIDRDYCLKDEYSPFEDIPYNDRRSCAYIRVLFERGITKGCSENPRLFCDTLTTRGQMSAFLIRAMFGEEFEFTTEPYFTDVPAGHPLFKYVQKMRDLRITRGYGDGTFGVNDYVTHSQMAAFIGRGLHGMP